MKKISSSWSMLALVLGVTAAGCSAGSDSSGNNDHTQTGSGNSALTTVKGHVTNEGTGSASLGFAGAQTLNLAKSVAISQIGDLGKLTQLATGPIDASGGFSLSIPDAKGLVVQALDGAGNVLGSSILESTLNKVNGVVTATPITTESSLEAKVLLDS